MHGSYIVSPRKLRPRNELDVRVLDSEYPSTHLNRLQTRGGGSQLPIVPILFTIPNSVHSGPFFALSQAIFMLQKRIII
jgi:hypothetical protein